MNIKGFNSIPTLASVEPKAKVDGNVRSQNASERDADGRREQAAPEIKKHLNQQEFDDAIKALSEHPGLKANNLTIQVETKDDCRVILIVDPQGNVVRRLSESQLWSASQSKERQTGRILDKAM